MESKDCTYKSPKEIKFPITKRFPSEKSSHTPGPIYDIRRLNDVKYKRPPSYTIGLRREKPGKSVLIKETATGLNIGPNSYHPEYQKLSQITKRPEFSIGKGKKNYLQENGELNHETFEIYHSMGKQLRSQKVTESRVAFGRGKRGKSACILKSEMSQQTTRLNLAHAHY